MNSYRTLYRVRYIATRPPKLLSRRRADFRGGALNPGRILRAESADCGPAKALPPASPGGNDVRRGPERPSGSRWNRRFSAVAQTVGSRVTEAAQDTSGSSAEPIVTGRPDFTESAETVPVGRFQREADHTFFSRHIIRCVKGCANNEYRGRGRPGDSRALCRSLVRENNRKNP